MINNVLAGFIALCCCVCFVHSHSHSYGRGRRRLLSSPPYYRTEFITDAEGHGKFFDDVIEHSNVLRWTDGSKAELEFKISNGQLVYGGDVMDRGKSQLRILKALVQLKDKYLNQGDAADRVIFILGNRDINKLRLWKELNIEDDYFKNVNNFGMTFAGSQAGDNWAKRGYEAHSKTCESATSQICKLKWILSVTMGAPTAFEDMKQELMTSSDEDVVAKYLELVDPTPGKEATSLLWKYNKYGHFFYYDAEKLILYSHALPSIGKFKNIITKDKGAEFNYKMTGLIKQYQEAARSFDYHTLHFSLYPDYYTENIRQLTIDPKLRDDESSIRQLKDEYVSLMNDVGYRYHLFGHTPIGDSPIIVDFNVDRYLINGDTGRGCATDRVESRGGSYHNIEIIRDDDMKTESLKYFRGGLKVSVRGKTADCKLTGSKNVEYEFELPQAELIGSRMDPIHDMASGWGLIKYRTKGGNYGIQYQIATTPFPTDKYIEKDLHHMEKAYYDGYEMYDRTM